jgi:DNA (cytosine-5)-methyltransferase 1
MDAQKNWKEELIYLDLFSGVGGFPAGLSMAGFTFKKHYFSEINKHAIANYRYNFKDAEYAGDIRTISKGTITERPNLITFGFPCQDLSIAGKGRGLSGSRSGLFYEAIRLIEEFKPEVFIFENVKGLLSNNKGKDFELVLRTIADTRLYECEWQLCNTKWVLPQNRERVYFVGHLAGFSKPKVFPITESDFKPNENGSEGVRLVSGCIDRNYHKGADGKRTMIQIKRAPLKFLNRNQKNIEGDYAYTIDSVNTGGVNVNGEIRRLTEIEVERLQGFPDDFTKWGDYNGIIKEISQTQRYRLGGNAVTTEVVKMVGLKIIANGV